MESIAMTDALGRRVSPGGVPALRQLHRVTRSEYPAVDLDRAPVQAWSALAGLFPGGVPPGRDAALRRRSGEDRADAAPCPPPRATRARAGCRRSPRPDGRRRVRAARGPAAAPSGAARYRVGGVRG